LPPLNVLAPNRPREVPAPSGLQLALGAALMLSAGAFAQVPPDPNNPNEAVPDKYTYTPYGENIKIDQAKKVAAAALAEATKRNWPMCISVVDTSGELVYFERMNDCQYASINIS
jgi:glc operon protein GlcG